MLTRRFGQALGPDQMNATSKPPLSYRDAGVDIEAGERLVDAISPMAKATARAGQGQEQGGQ